MLGQVLLNQPLYFFNLILYLLSVSFREFPRLVELQFMSEYKSTTGEML